MRVFTGSLATETNTFAPMPTGLLSFRDRGYFPAGQHPRELNLFAGPLAVLREVAPARGWTVVEGMVAAAQPSGTVTREAYEQLRGELLADLRGALPVDMVILGLHGAMVADGYDDCEGDVLTRVRQLVGPSVVVGAELDPHMHLSPAMVEQADVLVSMKEYPHTDVLERARELVEPCAKPRRRAASGRRRRWSIARWWCRSTPPASRPAASSTACRRWKARTVSCPFPSARVLRTATCRTWAARCWSTPTATSARPMNSP